MRTFFRLACPIVLAASLLNASASADPIAFGRPVEIYARLADPMMLSFAPNGDLYVGRDNTGSGGGANDSLRIHRILGIDRSVEQFGAPIVDPDAVLFDADGRFGGVAGGVLLGGSTATHTGVISITQANGTGATLLGPSSTFVNPNDFAIDASGRAIFADISRRDVKVFQNGAVTRLFATPAQPNCIAVDPHNGEIYVTMLDGVMSRHNADGSVIMAAFASSLGEYGTVAIEPGNSLLRPQSNGGGSGGGGGGGNSGGGGSGGGDPTDPNDGGGVIVRDYEPTIYSIANGDLLRLHADGRRDVLGTGFGPIWDLSFGPDGALYASDHANDRVLRIVPEPGTLLTLIAGGLFALRRRNA
ncbi:MAG: PEP-CTERM sorting domain-containing protein [Phycisphaerae bacterium]